MKNLIVLTSLLFATLNVSAQTIVEAPETSDPVHFYVYRYDSSKLYAVKVNKEITEGGLPTVTTNSSGRILISFNDASAAGSLPTYTIHSSSGDVLAEHEINKNKLARIKSLGSVAKLKYDGNSADTKNSYYVTCPLLVEVSRSTFEIKKVMPTCDDFE
jgi:hypothetical protein